MYHFSIILNSQQTLTNMMNRKVLIRVSCSEYSDWSDATKRKGSEMFPQQKLNFFSTNWICFFFFNHYR